MNKEQRFGDQVWSAWQQVFHSMGGLKFALAKFPLPVLAFMRDEADIRATWRACVQEAIAVKQGRAIKNGVLPCSCAICCAFRNGLTAKIAQQQRRRTRRKSKA